MGERLYLSSANGCVAICATKASATVQNSVWITPDPLTEERQILGGGKIHVESLRLLEARPGACSLAHRMGEGGRRQGEG